MTELARLINIYYRKFLKPAALYSAVFFGIVLAGFALNKVLILPVITGKGKSSGLVIHKGPGGIKTTVYAGKRVPQTYEQEMKFNASQLIYQNQARFYSDSEDTAAGPPIPDRSFKELRSLSAKFLRQWETYRVGESLESYEARLRPYVLPTSLQPIALRLDNAQPSSIGINGISGSKADTPRMYAEGLLLFRYDGDSAYGSMTGSVTYTGPSLQWANRSYRRTYSFVFKQVQYHWKVARVAAQTLGESQHYVAG